MKMKAPPNGYLFSSPEDTRKAMNSELWHACAGPMVSLPPVGSLVVYFPQGHSEQVAASMHKDTTHISSYPNLPSKLICMLHNVTLHADAETDEVYAQMTLQPVTKYDQEALLISDMGLKQNKQPAEFFCKNLTASDTSTHGGFSVPRRAAEKIFPPLDFSMQPPAQELVARDLHAQSWTFRHIYRGQPKRHLLTTGWSIFISSKRLSAGDAVLFVRDEKSKLLLGFRRANRQQTALSSSVISNDSMHIGILAAAAHAAANDSPFTILYNPRASPAEFVIPLAKYNKAMYTQVSLGMRFRMMFETEESGVRRYMGTVTGISDMDPVRWKNSQWRSLQVGWDESAAGERPSRVSVWEIEPVVTPFYMCPPPFVRQKFPQQPDNFSVLYGDTEIENAYKRGMAIPWLEDVGMKDGSNSAFPGLSLVQWMSMQQNHRFPPISVSTNSLNNNSNSISFEDSSKLLSFQSPYNFSVPSSQQSKSNKANQKNHLPSLLQQHTNANQHQQHQLYQQQNSVYNQIQQQQQHQISGNTQPQEISNRTSFQHQMEQHHTQMNLLQHNLSMRQQGLPEQQKTLQQQQQQHMLSPVSRVEPHLPLEQLSGNSLPTSTLVQSPQFPSNQLRVHPDHGGNAPSCSTSPSTYNCQVHVTPSNFHINSQQGPYFMGDDFMVVQTQNKSDASEKHELSNMNVPEQNKFKGIATQSYCLDAGNLCLEVEGDVHSQPRSSLSFAGANVDTLPPDALLSRGFDSQNLMSSDNMVGPRDIETELSEIRPQSFGIPDVSFKPGSNDNIGAAEDAAGVLGNGLWGNQTQRITRTYTKVQKRGSVGRTIDVTRYKGYEELRHDLACMFGIEGQLEDTRRTDWKLVYVDHEKDMLLVGDDPWEEFVSCVQSIKILSYSEVQQMSLDGDLGNVPVPNQASSGTGAATDIRNPWGGQYNDISSASVIQLTGN